MMACEFSKEEVVMRQTNRMAEEVNRMGEEMQARAQKFGREHEKAAETGFEAVSRSFSEANKGFQALASEMTDFSKRRFEDVYRTWEQLLRAQSFPDVVQVQTQYAQKAYEAYVSEMSKLGEMYLGAVRNTSKPVEETSRRFS
jgi:hypothetical protein